jgi:hypothetical protein
VHASLYVDDESFVRSSLVNPFEEDVLEEERQGGPGNENLIAL